jgi:hypothetical protein
MLNESSEKVAPHAGGQCAECYAAPARAEAAAEAQPTRLDARKTVVVNGCTQPNRNYMKPAPPELPDLLTITKESD